jgi:hypothetical protein
LKRSTLYFLSSIKKIDRDVIEPLNAIVGCFFGVSEQGCNLAHGLDANNALDGQIGLVRECAGEIIGTDLIGRNKRLCDEVLSPLVQEAILIIIP